MSGWSKCTCLGTRKERMKNWYVLRRHYNLSYFERPKGQPHFSDYSVVCCRNCTMMVSTKSKYVDSLPDGE
jgi:hypothetical protein